MAIIKGRPKISLTKAERKKRERERKKKNKIDESLGLKTNKKIEKVRKERPHIEIIGPQPGPQTTFLSCPADIVIYGGSAGGGKSFGLLLDPLRYVQNPHFGAVLLRRTYPEIKNEGGLWDEAMKLYLPLKARPKQLDLSWSFPSGASISFAHLQHEKNIYSWQGSQVPYLGFDELTHFTARQFWYLLSRQRNVAGIPNLVRATCNPDPDSFVRSLIDWWIDINGHAIPERSGAVRYFVRIEDDLKWADSAEDLVRRYPGQNPRSLTFISARLSDNQILMQKDPNYLATLMSLPQVDRKRLLDGNWNVKAASGLYFKRQWFGELVKPDAVPPLLKKARGWDLAGTAESDPKKGGAEPAATAGVKMGRAADGTIYILDLQFDKLSPMAVEKLIVSCAKSDGISTVIRLPQDPGQAGKFQIAHFAKLLLGYEYHSRVMTGDKVTRAGPFSSAAEYGRVKVVEGAWNETLFNHLEAFPPEEGSPDIVDAAVEAFHQLTRGGRNVKNISPVSVLVTDL